MPGGPARQRRGAQRGPALATAGRCGVSRRAETPPTPKKAPQNLRGWLHPPPGQRQGGGIPAGGTQPPNPVPALPCTLWGGPGTPLWLLGQGGRVGCGTRTCGLGGHPDTPKAQQKGGTQTLPLPETPGETPGEPGPPCTPRSSPAAPQPPPTCAQRPAEQAEQEEAPPEHGGGRGPGGAGGRGGGGSAPRHGPGPPGAAHGAEPELSRAGPGAGPGVGMRWEGLDWEGKGWSGAGAGSGTPVSPGGLGNAPPTPGWARAPYPRATSPGAHPHPPPGVLQPPYLGDPRHFTLTRDPHPQTRGGRVSAAGGGGVRVIPSPPGFPFGVGAADIGGLGGTGTVGGGGGGSCGPAAAPS